MVYYLNLSKNIAYKFHNYHLYIGDNAADDALTLSICDLNTNEVAL